MSWENYEDREDFIAEVLTLEGRIKSLQEEVAALVGERKKLEADIKETADALRDQQRDYRELQEQHDNGEASEHLRRALIDANAECRHWQSIANSTAQKLKEIENGKRS